jgi:hypothetical protein
MFLHVRDLLARPMEDPDDDEPFIPAGWPGPNRKCRNSAEATDDDEPLFPNFPSKDDAEPVHCVLGKRVRREKRVPPSALDKAKAHIEAGGTEVSLLRTPIEMGMDEKLASLIDYVTEHQHVISVELQAINI